MKTEKPLKQWSLVRIAGRAEAIYKVLEEQNEWVKIQELGAFDAAIKWVKRQDVQLLRLVGR